MALVAYWFKTLPLPKTPEQIDAMEKICVRMEGCGRLPDEPANP